MKFNTEIFLIHISECPTLLHPILLRRRAVQCLKLQQNAKSLYSAEHHYQGGGQQQYSPKRGTDAFNSKSKIAEENNDGNLYPNNSKKLEENLIIINKLLGII